MKIKTGIIGSAGYTGGELIRLLIHHPETEIIFAQSKSHAGKPLAKIHRDLIGDTDMIFSDQIQENIDVLFLCMGHGDSKKFLTENKIPDHIRIIDLSQDFRLNVTNGFVYGLPELNREKIVQATQIANPGCFATCIQLGLLPLAEKQILPEEVHIHATTGSTGAGQSLSESSHFSWRSNNLSVYKVFEHQHLQEIAQSIQQLQPALPALNFIPERGSFTRGIMASMYVHCELSEKEATDYYVDFYKTHPFVHISAENIDLKQVVNTNKCIIHLKKKGNKLFINSIIDNLLKGASGQAIQNMNLMFGKNEQAGLKLKASAF